MKKFLAILLSVVMLLGCVVISTSAAEGAVDVAADKVTYLWATECGKAFDASGNAQSVTTTAGEEMYSFGDNCYVTYEINVAQSGTYDISLNVASQWGVYRYYVFVDDERVINNDIPDSMRKSNGATYWSPSDEIYLTAGTHTLKVQAWNGMSWISGVRIGPKGSFPDYANAYSTLYDNRNQDTNGAHDDGFYGYRTRINAEFEAVSIHIWNGGDGAGAIWNIAVYKWAGSLGATLATEALAEKEFQAYWDRYADIEFDAPQEAGEYLFYLTSKSASGIWIGVSGHNGVPETGSYGYNYINSEEATQVHIPRIYVITTEPYEGDLFSGTTAPGAEPEDTTAPETDAPVEPETPVEPEEPAYDIEGGKANFVPVVGNSDYTVQIAKIASCAHGQMLADLRSGDVLNFKVNIKEAGTYDLSFGYIWQWGTDFKVSVDGAEEVVVPANTFVNWSTVSLSSAVKYTFTEGVHDIKVTMGGTNSGSHLYAFNICAENTTVAYPLVSPSVLGNIAPNHPHGVGSSNFGFRTVISAPFTAFEMEMPTWTAKDAYCSIALYKWAGDYATTLAGSPVATKTFNPMTDGAWNGISFDTALDAGEYLFYIYDASAQNCGIYVYKSDDYVANGYTLIGNTEYTNQAPNLRVTLETPTADNVFSRGEAAGTYVYVNSLDGEVLYTGNVALGEITDAMLAQLNAYANGTYNSFVEFEELSCVNNVHTFYSVHNTEATVTVNGEAVAPAEGGVYYMLTAEEPAEGQYFAGWYDGDKLISYSPEYKFFPDGATESLVAKYAEEAPTKNSAVVVEPNRTNDKLTVKVTPVYGDDVEIINFGYYVATSAEPMTADEVITNGQKLDSEAPHVYMVRVHDLLETTKAQNIYIVGYFTYNDGEAIQTEPTDVIVVEVPNA